MRDDALSTREPVSEPTRFTPGPWTWEADDDSPLDRPSIIVRGSRVIDRTQSLRRDMRDMPSANQKVAYVYTPTEPVGPHGGQKCTKATVKEGQANARLIAAAPDLLAACEAIAEWWFRDGVSGNKETDAIAELARVAIAKANGGATL